MAKNNYMYWQGTNEKAPDVGCLTYWISLSHASVYYAFSVLCSSVGLRESRQTTLPRPSYILCDGDILALLVLVRKYSFEYCR